MRVDAARPRVPQVPTRRRARPGRGALGAAVLALVVGAGCTSPPSPTAGIPSGTLGTNSGSGAAGGSGAAPTPTTSTPITSTPATPTDVVARAKNLATQYDYAGALALLANRTDSGAEAARAQIQAAQVKAVPFADNSTIPHIFYHSLIVDPARTFTAPDAAGFGQYMVTVREFTAELEQIHRNGYVLVHPERIAAKDPTGAMAYQPILLPPGKKPLVLSVDDVSYYEYMAGKGFASDLFVDSDGSVRNHYTDGQGVTKTGSFDIVPIVDDFVAAHPDFSYRGDKGSIALTGYNGVLGYRTSVRKYADTPVVHDAQNRARVVADAMKAQGWHFASHSWGHIDMTTSSPDAIRADAQLWDAEVRPIVGDTPEIVFAFGADIADATPYAAGNPKFDILHGAEKFDYFFTVDATTPYRVQLSAGTLRQTRINVDGIRMQTDLNGTTKALTPFFDVRASLDPQRPMPVPMPVGSAAAPVKPKPRATATPSKRR